MLTQRRTLIGLFITLALGLAPVFPAEAVPHHRLVAVGDLHGDFAAWREIATAAGLIDPRGRWVGGQTVLVQVGDVVDRGPQSLNIVQDLMRLQKEAPHAGGRVVSLVGNHEAMNVTGDLRYVSAADYAAFATADSQRLREEVFAKNRAQIEAAYRQQNPGLSADAIHQAWLNATPLGQIEHQRAWGPNGPIGRWVIGNPAVIRIDGTLFVHGGISAAYATMPLAKINQLVASALRRADTASAAIINDPNGPLWYRGLAIKAADPSEAPDDDAAHDAAPLQSPSTGSIAADLDRTLKAFGADRMVIGHTPILSGIAVLYQGKLIRIDTGISAFYGGKLSYLEIIDGEPVPHEVARSAPSN